MASSSPQRRTVRHSSCLPLAAAVAISTSQAATATVGRVHSTRTTRTTRGSSTSIRAIAAWATTFATMGSLYGQFVLRVRTNLCSVTGKEGQGRRSSRAVRLRSKLPSTARVFLREPRKTITKAAAKQILAQQRLFQFSN